MIDRATRDIIDESHKKMIAGWKLELQDPNLPASTRDLLTHMVTSMEENLKYTSTAVRVSKNHTVVVRHKRTEPRPLIWEEKRLGPITKLWRRFCIWLDWYMNK